MLKSDDDIVPFSGVIVFGGGLRGGSESPVSVQMVIEHFSRAVIQAFKESVTFCRNEDIMYRTGILMRTKQIAIIAFALWLVVISLFMLFTGRFDLALFFVLGFIGFLVIIELIDLRSVKHGYSWYIRFLVVAGIIISGAIIVQKVLEILGLEIILW